MEVAQQMQITKNEKTGGDSAAMDRYVILESKEGHQFFIGEEFAKRSGTIKTMLESQGPFIASQSRTLRFSEIS